MRIAFLIAGFLCRMVTADFGVVDLHPISRAMRLEVNTYNQIRPGSKPGRPLDVKVSADIENVDFTSSDVLNVDLTLRQEWVDPRLAHNYNYSISFSGDVTDEIWHPDTYFRQAVREDLKRRSVTLRADGTVFYTTRLRVALVCPYMAYSINHSSKYQEPTCTMDMASYGHTIDDIVYSFKEGQSTQFNPGRYSNKFRIKRLDTSDCTENTVTESYSCLRLEINLTNKIH